MEGLLAWGWWDWGGADVAWNSQLSGGLVKKNVFFPGVPPA